MIPVRGYAGQQVGVLGLGRSGLTAARALRAGGARILVWDDTAKPRSAAAAEGFTLRDLSRPGALEALTALIVSPGIAHLYPQPHPVIASAWMAGVPVDNDIGLFFRSYAANDWAASGGEIPKVIAVTGSNGKSTTSALVHHVMTQAGRPAQLAGNIGRGALDLDPAVAGEIAVLELSSYQIDLARSLTPEIAVFLNLSPDHLDRHGGIGGYFAAKRRLFAEGDPAFSVIGVDDPEGRYLAGQMAGRGPADRIIRVSSGCDLSGFGQGVFMRAGVLIEMSGGQRSALVDLRGIPGLAGVHNHQNACAAYAVARTLDIAPRVIEAAFRSFKGLPHRGQVVAEKRGVRFVNNSKATNPKSAAQALQSFERVHWIVGGQGKQGGLGVAVDHLDAVVKAYLVGTAAESFARQLGKTRHEICGTVAAAVAKAAAAAASGDVVLLAPAAASFDQFKDFEERGEAFIAAVARLPD